MIQLVAAAIQKVGDLTLPFCNLWQQGVRSLFTLAVQQNDWSRDQTWALIRQGIIERAPDATEEELQLVRAILYEEHNITLEDGQMLWERYAHCCPLIDALKELL